MRPEINREERKLLADTYPIKKHFKCYTKEYLLFYKGVLSMKGGLFALLCDYSDSDNKVDLSKRIKVEFMTKLGSKAVDKDRVFNNTASQLVDDNLLVKLGTNSWMINPSYRSKVDNKVRLEKLQEEYLNHKHGKDGKCKKNH